MPNRIAWSLTGLVAVGIAFAQVPAVTEFEVATVRPNTLDDRIVSINVGPGGRFAVRGYTLVLLMQRAYGLMDWNISGGPRWIRTDRFDIAAKAIVTGNLTEQQLQPMLQRLLAERFKLKLHRSSRELPGYALLVGRGGPKVKASAEGIEQRDTFRFSGAGLSGQGISMETLARFVGGKLGLVAVDETRLKGLYDVKAEWKVEADQAASALPSDDARDALRYAVISALQDQLGLALTAKRITVQMLVIDGAEKASALEN